MSIKSSLLDLGNGVVRSWKQLAAHVVTTFSVLFTLVTAIDFFAPTIKIKTSFVFGSIALVSLLHGLRKVWKPSKVEICIATCATRLEVTSLYTSPPITFPGLKIPFTFNDLPDPL